MLPPMGDMLILIWWAVIKLFRSRASLEAEILTLRHQLNMLRRKSPKRLAFRNLDRLSVASLYRIAPRVAFARRQATRTGRKPALLPKRTVHTVLQCQYANAHGPRQRAKSGKLGFATTRVNPASAMSMHSCIAGQITRAKRHVILLCRNKAWVDNRQEHFRPTMLVETT